MCNSFIKPTKFDPKKCKNETVSDKGDLIMPKSESILN